MDLLESSQFSCRVSSVLNKDIKQYGKQYMFDCEADTAWSSNEGTPQWITIHFDDLQAISAFSFQFQGGFAGKDIAVVIKSGEGRMIYEDKFYPEDVNSVQNFSLKSPITEKIVSYIKFEFASSTDLFGRVIVYTLKVFA